MDSDQEWKKSVGFPINFSPDTTDDDNDISDVVMRHRRQSEALLADRGDGAEADLLGTTPPRQRIRENKKRRTLVEAAMIRDRRVADDYVVNEQSMADRPRNRLSLKLQRARDREHKLDLGQREPRADSLPSPNPMTAVPTLVESCSRFMSLTSRLKCRETDPQSPEDSETECRIGGGVSSLRGACASGGFEFPGVDTPGNEVLASRVNFHKTFSMLINMGNIDKGCRRTISREEQVWQNELKDLIWLEIQAKIAGRTLAEQDVFLCSQRNVVPAIVNNIRDYRFMNANPCRSRARLGVIAGSAEDVRGDSGTDVENEGSGTGCLSFNCQQCSEAVGRAMQEVGTLLDSFYNAAALYPSSHAMTQEHPLVATNLFKNRIKAMCLWYNTAMHMRMKMLAVRRMLRTMRHKARRPLSHLASTDSDLSRQSSESHRQSQVRFNVSNTPTDSSNSDSSGQIDVIKETEEGSESDQARDQKTERPDAAKEVSEENAEEHKADENKTEGDESKDDVDSSVIKKSGPATPEIVISDSRYGTADTAASTESGYTSSPECDVTSHADSVYHIGSLEDLTSLRLLDKCDVSIYRSYHYEILKTQGVRRCMQFMQKMRSRLLDKVLLTLEKPDNATLNASKEENEDVFDDTKEDDLDKTDHQDEEAKKLYELRRYGCWSEECISMGLPSYRPHFLLLATIGMEAVHDYLSLRLEDRPQNPSCLTVKQLIHELKEGLDIATEMRAAYARNIELALAGQAAGDAARRDLLLIVRTFDGTVETVLKQYLSYLVTMSAVEAMPRSCLQAEWTFTARLARRVRCAAILAPLTFTEIACNQLDRLLNQFKQKFEQLNEFEKSGTDPDKQWVYALCRAVQQVYTGSREPTLHAAQWARALAARLARAPAHAYIKQRANIFESLMNIRDLLVRQTKLILEKSRPDGRTEDLPYDSLDIVMARVRELMLQIYKLGFELHKELYRFAQGPFEVVQEKTMRRRPASLQPMRPHDQGPARRRRPKTIIINESFNPMLHKELHRFVHDPSRHPQSSRRSINLNTSPPKSGRGKLFRSDSIIEDAESTVLDDRLFDPIGHHADHQSSIELLLTGEQPQSEEEVVELRGGGEVTISEEEQEWAKRVARAVVEFAKCWMLFVVERCETGRGLRPRWACQGLEFLMLACDPCNTRHLSEEEFDDLKRKMDGCISHVIGSRPAPQRSFDSSCSTPDHQPRRRPRIHSPLPSAAAVPARAAPAPPTPPAEPDPLLDFQPLDPAQHSARVLEAVRQVDIERDEKLRAMRSVGRVVEAKVDNYEPKLRQLKFKWQRGLKIGAGTFGKVYTVVNTESGQLLAMKELNIGAGDRRALQRAANELRVLEGVVHPHLVYYHGCELHREEMLIFMELCVEGSLEALIATSGALAEHMVRRYTKQLVSAVAELHARSIAHRDIKSGNIFLTNEGHCLKLGDFGCAVKIRAHTTAAGELMGHVGTQAYMAPEVFMKPTGHGRAADIWSLGCVVTEMAAGKRPFSEYDSNVQIMFVVGMGGRPHIPECLSEEGQQFCLACLTHEPEQRPPAEALSLHHFLKLQSDQSDEDCKCEPAYLIT